MRPWPAGSRREIDPFIIARLLMFANYVVNYDLDPKRNLPDLETKLRKILAER